MRIAFLDVETSGLLRDPSARVVEWGLSVWEGEKEIFRGESLVSGDSKIPEEVSRINGITTEMTVGFPTFPEIWNQWKPSLEGAIVVAHNLSFDMGMMNRDLMRAGIPPEGNPGIDSLAMFRRMMPDLSSYKLTELVKTMGVIHQNPHRALGDVDAMREVLTRLFEKPLATHDEGVLRMWCSWGGTSAHRYQKDVLVWSRERSIPVTISRQFPGGLLSWGKMSGTVISLNGETVRIRDQEGNELSIPMEEIMAVNL